MRVALAVVVAAVLVLSAPFISQIRSAIRTNFPGHFVTIIGGIIAALVLAGLAAAFLRIRDRRLFRYGSIATALVIALAYSLWQQTGKPEVDVVERFHFVEYGLITFLFYRAWRPLGDDAVLVLPVLAALIVGTADEWLQWFIPVRVGEMRDVLLNGIAIGCGLLFSVGVDPPPSFGVGLRPGSRARIARFAAATVLVFAAFFHVVHLGFDIRDDEVGTFKSRYSKARLGELARQRAEQWRLRPPVVLHRVSREDQYMTEGVLHARARNDFWSAGDYVSSWNENRILEKYYAPVLDTPSYEARTGHRWPDEQRNDAAARVAALAPATGTFVSTANTYPIHAWPALAFWIGAAMLAGAIMMTA
ncbi:MAG: hypothetical protein A3H96_08275 [Acidobacteria bacterium RIFCSPLOWO2_02_FULL_67_36]|nr:MAG: hypothetical protein A3H96_08275 [Acidobacteria bacterium RIFCSPLOWO2_02_FULL_67_36]OFW24674.1 MAG: hypothetical protein A3G21_17160 [Acidobacteria bacterium RIFCSPLOWO2_12_FULL_66_21]